jgi:hypothetical protein
MKNETTTDSVTDEPAKRPYPYPTVREKVGEHKCPYTSRSGQCAEHGVWLEESGGK